MIIDRLKNRKLIIPIIFGLALVSRLFWLNKMPTGITNDELHFVMNAKAVYYGFTDMSGKWNPLSLKTIPDNPSAEITSLILAPLIGPLPLNLFTARLPFALINSLLVVVIALIVYEIFPAAGWIGGLVAIINPWIFFNGRMAFDQPIATFFLMLTWWLLLKMKGRWIRLTILTAFIGFFTYIGTKVIFLPFIIGIIGFCWLKNNKKYGVEYLMVGISALVMTGYFMITTLNGPSRIGELVTPFSQLITNRVELERSQSIENSGTRLFINRYSEYFSHFSRKYFNSFSPDVLFNKGDETYLISLWKQGYFYYIDLLFLIIGGYFLFRERRPYFFLIFGLLALAPIPEAIRADDIPAYAFHSCLQYPILIVVIAVGIYKFLTIFPKLWLPTTIVYLLFFMRMLNLYFFRYPVYQPEGFSFSNRLLARYLQLDQINDRQVVVVTSEPSRIFRQYLFYSQLYTKDKFEKIKYLYQQNRNDITFNNIRFTTDKSNQLNQKETVYIGQTAWHHLDSPRTAIRQINSSLEMFSIYNSNLCPIGNKERINIPGSLNDLAVENLTDEIFCNQFVEAIN